MQGTNMKVLPIELNHHKYSEAKTRPLLIDKLVPPESQTQKAFALTLAIELEREFEQITKR